MNERISFFISRLRERLWVKPLISCLLSISAAFIASAGDYYYPQAEVMSVSNDSLETLLTIISASMLVMAVFAVGSMLSAYSSVSSMATPRAFAIVVTDDVSQYALSIFIGAFIFSVIGLVALMNNFYQETGRFVLFLQIIAVFIIVILGFVRWVDNIARLGTLSNTIAKVEMVAESALARNAQHPRMGGAKQLAKKSGYPIYTDRIGYLQRIDMSKLQAIAEQFELTINVSAMVGRLVLPNVPLVHLVSSDSNSKKDTTTEQIINAFIIDDKRTFDEDPRFSLVVLSEIASRALSPAVNDPGTAIDIIGTLTRLLFNWATATDAQQEPEVLFDRVTIPEIFLGDIFDDAFNAIARDGAGSIEVMLRLVKVYQSLATVNNDFKVCASRHTHIALSHAEQQLCLAEELDLLKRKANSDLNTSVQ
ncbi:DUF2254 domain-containing protein [Pseudoalteromonas sp.]|uniref:DUF2254 domain-containing protein n=1 Tax=Pseudoalteromonas sp. TaxID=53249 RepID=UPI0035635CEC